MPKVVDHEQRRREIVEAIWAVILRQGLMNATMREVAKEAGYSSGILAHYFADKSDLLVQAMQAAHREVHRMLGDSPSNEELTGLAARRRMLAAVEISFWGEAIGNAKLLQINALETEAFNARVRERLEEAQRGGELRAGT